MTAFLLKYGLVFSGFVMFFLAVWLSLAYKRTKSIPVRYLALFFWLKTAFIIPLMLGTFDLFSDWTRVLLTNIAISALHFTLIPLVAFACYLWFPRYKKLLVGTALIITVLAVIIGFFLMPSQYDPITWGISKFSGTYAFLSHLVGMVAVGLAIFILGLKSADKKIVLRSALLGLGMAGAALSGNFQAMFPQYLLMFRVINDISHIMMGAGVLIRPSK